MTSARVSRNSHTPVRANAFANSLKSVYAFIAVDSKLWGANITESMTRIYPPSNLYESGDITVPRVANPEVTTSLSSGCFVMMTL